MPTKAPKALRDQQRDEAAGIRPGRANLNPPNLIREEVPVPDLSELEVVAPIRKRIAFLVHQHCDLGQAIKEAERDRKKDTEELKAILAEQLAETPSFTVEDYKVTRYNQNRESISKDTLRTVLLNEGMHTDRIDRILKAAVKITPVETLRVTMAGELE